jgi:uncharacterized protein
VAKELSFKVPDLTLEGTLEIPNGSGKFPAVLLLPGSGPTDRDGNSGLGVQTNLLKIMADELAKNGVASFRFDKRAISRYKASWPKDLAKLNSFFAWNKFVTEAEAAKSFLSAQPEIDSKRVAVLGHSEGSLIALQIAFNQHANLEVPKSLVLLGSTGRPMGPILHEQIARLLKKQGATSEIGKPFLDYTDAACATLAAGKPLPPNTPPGLAALFNPTVLDIMGAYCRIDPADLAKSYTGPVLVINGQRDTQVSAERDTPRLVASLKARINGKTSSFIAPDASHNLKSTRNGADDDAFTGPIVPGVVDRIIQFLKENLK